MEKYWSHKPTVGEESGKEKKKYSNNFITLVASLTYV